MPAPFNDLSLSIGNTPLVKLNRISQHNILVKMESRNPANSVKCRIGANMIWQAEQDGLLKPGMEIVEPTSGNTGIALAFVAAARGYPITLTMPNTMSIERRKVLLALGAKLILSDGSKGMKGAIAAAESVVASDPTRYFMPQQFSNPANPAIHEQTTGPEIWQDTDGAIDILISGVGTGGTLSGISRYIKNTCGKAITTVAVEPESSTLIRSALSGTEPSHAPHKIQGIGAGFLPDNLDLTMVDLVEAVSDSEAMQWAHRLMKEEGILVGISSGAAMAAAERVAARPENEGKTLVVILPDSAERYLSSALFEGAFTEIEA
ncbi:Cysteine synthase A [Zhongshania aliphaticivorans]|uniref:Cysteine synthase n=1 Tax=Zhongshania aliphaticivorans TaxID=1470434 RepID=A0A5S9NFG7_9GAMM|nr:cysteine synthase A [Zhongshania aliphaticivorans]CAA0088235.1 Cysteine synthase A [Zhongshania aliphaticivorans]CAA0116197.1 Cysteine synthase A [Zhongshania aliphaticivorans]CAA0120382.1 Cysteine synthase A [Zhongshania aliphaticivorans]